MPATLTNKREVRDYVKQTLQPCVDAHVLDVEDQKQLIKSVADSTDVPADEQAVGTALYNSVVHHLAQVEAPEDTHAKVKALLASLRTAVDVSASPNGGTSDDSGPATGAAPTTSDGKPSLSLSGLKARLAKRREEMQRPASQSATAGEAHADAAPSLSGPRETSKTAVPDVDNVSLADGTESYRPTTAPVTTDVSPAMGPIRSLASPPPMPHDAGDDDHTDAQSSVRDGEPPVKRERVEVVLSAAPIEEEDLYAGLPLQQQPRGRGGYRGGYRGRGRGYGPSPYGPPPAFGRGGYGEPYHEPYPYPHGSAPPGAAGPYRGGPDRGMYRGRGGGGGGSGGYGYGGAPQPYYAPPAPFRGGYM